MKLAKISKTLRVDQPKLFRLDVLQNLNAYTALRSSIETNHGPSALPPWALKDAVSVVNKHLCFILNECINNSTFPEILKTADVTPIFKKNDPEEPDNYRPISIIPCISKVIEILIKEQLTEYLQKTNY